MRQAEAAKAEPVFVAQAQKLRSFLLTIWAIFQSTKLNEISTLECVHYYFFCLCSAHLHEIGMSCLLGLYLEYFDATRQWPFF